MKVVMMDQKFFRCKYRPLKGFEIRTFLRAFEMKKNVDKIEIGFLEGVILIKKCINSYG